MNGKSGRTDAGPRKASPHPAHPHAPPTLPSPPPRKKAGDQDSSGPTAHDLPAALPPPRISPRYAGLIDAKPGRAGQESGRVSDHRVCQVPATWPKITHHDLMWRWPGGVGVGRHRRHPCGVAGCGMPDLRVPSARSPQPPTPQGPASVVVKAQSSGPANCKKRAGPVRCVSQYEFFTPWRQVLRSIIPIVRPADR